MEQAYLIEGNDSTISGSHCKNINVTNVLAATTLGCAFDMNTVVNEFSNMVYDPSKMKCIIWRHRSIGNGRAAALLFPSGYMSVNGNRSVYQAKVNVRQFARLLQRAGHMVNKSRTKVVSVSATYKLPAELCLDMVRLVDKLGAQFEPELFSGACLRTHDFCLLVFQTGSIVITGLKDDPCYSDGLKDILRKIEKVCCSYRRSIDGL